MTPGTPELRARWLLDPGVRYLNHGSFGATPRSVLAAQQRLREEMEREPVDFLWRRLPARMGAAREAVSRFLGADPAGLAFVPNATTGVQTVLGSFDWREGDEVVLADHGYNAVKQQLHALAARHGVVPIWAKVPFPLEDPGQVVEAFRAAVGPRTRLIIVDHVTSPTALIFPVRALREAFDLPILVDGAHAPAFLELDIGALGVDFYTGNLHKWLCAAKGCALLWTAPAWRERVTPLVPSHAWGGPYTEQFDWLGTFDPTPFLTAPDAIAAFEALGPAAVRAANHALVQEGRRRIAHALGVPLPHPDDPALYGAMAAIPVPGAPASESLAWNARMRERGIEVPFTSFDQRLWVRISGQLYNQPEDYVALAEALCA